MNRKQLTMSVALVLCLLVITGSALPSASHNYGLQFDGNDTVLLPGSFPITSQITIEMWAKLNINHLTRSNTMFRKQGAFLIEPGNVPSSNQYVLHLWTSRGEAEVFSGPVIVGEWNHIAATYDGTALRFYVNGLQVSSKPWTGTINTSSLPLFLGNSLGEWFQGETDEIRLWNVARTTNEITNNMNQPLTGSEFGLVGYWPLNEGTGQIAHDNSGAGHDGRLGSSTDPDDADPAWIIPDELSFDLLNAIATHSGSGRESVPVAILIAGDLNDWDFGAINVMGHFTPSWQIRQPPLDGGVYRLGFRNRFGPSVIIPMGDPRVAVDSLHEQVGGGYRTLSLTLDADDDGLPDLEVVLQAKNLADSLEATHLKDGL